VHADVYEIILTRAHRIALSARGKAYVTIDIERRIGLG
jgi:hypothetical protein